MRIIFIALIAALVVQSYRVKKYKDMCKRLTDEKNLSNAEPEQKPTAYTPQKTSAASPYDMSFIRNTAVTPSVEKASVPEPTEAVKEALQTDLPNLYSETADKQSVTESAAEIPRKAESAPVPAAVEPVHTDKKRSKVSSMNIMLILGAMLIIISGLIFATTTWKFLSGGVRAAVILSFSAIFFAVSAVAERKLNLEKTGLLFYTLGSVFLPTTIIAAGFFSAFGEWFSLNGEGRPLLLAVTFAALSSACIHGSCRYRHAAFSWAGLVSLSAAVCSLILQFTDDSAFFALSVSVYGLAVIFAGERLSKIQSEKFAPLLSMLNTFAMINTACLSVSSLVAAGMSENGVITLVSCVLFATGYLKSCFTEKSGFGGAVPFALFMTCGLFAAFSPDDFGGTANTLAAASAVPAVLSFMNIIPDKLKGALKYVSGFFAAAALLICGFAAFLTEPSWVSLGAYAVLAVEILLLGLIHKDETSGRLMRGIFPAACVIISEMLSKLIFTENHFGQYAFLLAVIAAMQAVFVLVKRLGIRTLSSDIIFALFGVISEICVLSVYGHRVPENALILYGAAFLLSLTAVLLPALKTESAAVRTVFASAATLWSGTGAYVLGNIIWSGIASAADTGFVSMAVMSAALAAASLLVTFRSKNSVLDAAVSISARSVIGIYALNAIASGEQASILIAIIIAMSVIRYARRGSTPELCVSASILATGFGAFFLEPTPAGFAAYAVLAAVIFVSGFAKRGDKAGKRLYCLLPAGIVSAEAMAFKLMTLFTDGKPYIAYEDGSFYAQLASLAIIAAFQAAFIFGKKLKIRTAFSDFIFAGYAVLIGSFSYTFTDSAENYLLRLGGFILTAAIIALPAVFSDNDRKQTILTGAAFIWGGYAVSPIGELIGYVTKQYGSDAIDAIAVTVTAAVLIGFSLLISYKSTKRPLDLTASIITRAITGLYVIIMFAGENVTSPLFVLLAVMSAARFIKFKSKPELVSALLLFITATGTASADIFDGVGFEQSLLFMCGASAVIYICTLFMGEESPYTQISNTFSRYALGAINCLCLLCISFGMEDTAYIFFALLFLLMTITAFYSAKSTAFLAAPLALMYPAAAAPLESFALEKLCGGSYEVYNSFNRNAMFTPASAAILVIIAISTALSYVLHKNVLREKSRKKYYLDCFAFTRFVGVLCYMDVSASDKAEWLTILLFAACLVSLCRKKQSVGFRRWIFTVSAAFPVIAWIKQPFFHIPEIIYLELNILPLLIYCFVLRFFWKHKIPLIDNITFAVYTLSYIVLFFSAVASGEIADGLIIVITALAVLIFSFTVKKKKWFLLSVSVIVISSLFMSRGFWTSLAWWVYLLAAGLILIAVGAANEMKKQSAAKNEKSGLEKKITRFMSEWTW